MADNIKLDHLNQFGSFILVEAIENSSEKAQKEIAENIRDLLDT